MPLHKSRYQHALQTPKLARPGRLATLAAVGAALAVQTGCGNGDDAAFSDSTTAEPTTQTSGGSSTVATTSTTSDSGAEADSSSTTESTASESTTTVPTETTQEDGAVLSADAELLVSFTYEASSTDRAKRPYIAVWIEDTEGNLIDTISLWYEQGEKGQKWLDELRQWYSANDEPKATLSGATRVAGDYIVSWDGTDADGNQIAQGDYVLYIEASREHGPYSLMSAELTMGEDTFVTALVDNEELSAASAQLLL